MDRPPKPQAEPESSECANCGADVGGRFCANCGQKAGPLRLRLGPWLSEAWDLSASLETRMWATLVGLTLRPGKTVLRYLRGERMRFTSPLKYAVLAVGLWMFAFSIANEESEDASGLVVFLTSYGQLVHLLALPFLAGAVHLAFRGSRFTYAEHLCMCLYMGGHSFVWRALLATAGCLGVPAIALTTVDLVLILAYSVWMVVSFHAGTVRWIWLRVLGFLLGFLLVSFFVDVFILIVLKIQERL